MNWQDILKGERQSYGRKNIHPLIMEVFCSLDRPVEPQHIYTMIEERFRKENEDRKEGKVRDKNAYSGKTPQKNYSQINVGRMMGIATVPRIKVWVKKLTREGKMVEVNFGSNYQFTGWKWVGGPCG